MGGQPKGDPIWCCRGLAFNWARLFAVTNEEWLQEDAWPTVQCWNDFGGLFEVLYLWCLSEGQFTWLYYFGYDCWFLGLMLYLKALFKVSIFGGVLKQILLHFDTASQCFWHSKQTYVKLIPKRIKVILTPRLNFLWLFSVGFPLKIACFTREIGKLSIFGGHCPGLLQGIHPHWAFSKQVTRFSAGKIGTHAMAVFSNMGFRNKPPFCKKELAN